MSKTKTPTTAITNESEIDKSVFIKTADEKKQLKELKSAWKKSQKKT